jgi:hypothetical protein
MTELLKPEHIIDMVHSSIFIFETGIKTWKFNHTIKY